MNEKRCFQDQCDCGDYNSIQVISNDCNSPYGYKDKIQKDLFEIQKGIREEYIGVNDIIRGNRCKGISEVYEGIRDVKCGLGQLTQDLKYVKLDCKEREIKQDILEVEEGLNLVTKGVQDVERGNIRLGVKEIQVGICREEAGYQKLVKDLSDLTYIDDFDCDCKSDYSLDYDNASGYLDCKPYNGKIKDIIIRFE